jgi:uncharacterized membrane protein
MGFVFIAFIVSAVHARVNGTLISVYSYRQYTELF